MAIVKRPARRRPSPPAGDVATTSFASSQLRADLGPPIDGRYQLLAKVGSGVFGDVYRAKVKRTGEIVAVKCLRWEEEEDDPDGLQLDKLLEEEVRALEACQGHPHIVQVLDHGRRRDAGFPEAFIVMEYVGPSLQSTILHRGRSTSARRYCEDDCLIEKILDVLGLDDIEGWSKYDGSMISPPLQGSPRRSRLRDLFPPPGVAGGNDLPKLSPAGFEVLSGLLTCNPDRRMTAAAALQHCWFGMLSTST
ncbi:hypothetical protein ABZP36_034696 [Zizania latifolia]